MRLPEAELVCAEVSARVSPKAGEVAKVTSLARRMQRRVRGALKDMGVRAEVRLDGSVAKGTWLSGDVDIDIFVRLPTDVGRDRFRSLCVGIAKGALGDHPWIERYAEHPYVEGWVEGTRVNVVPCYLVKRGEWASSTDRTPFHTAYVRRRLTPRLRGEVRLLKRFMKGIGVYGAEIRVGGFSGYLCELLILRYGSFLNFVAHAARLKEEVIDLAGHYAGRERDARRIFAAPLVVVDPVDRRRNAAAAVRESKTNELVAASLAFAEGPSLAFFYPPEVGPLSAGELVSRLGQRGSDLLFVRIGEVRAVPDVLWGQLYRSQRALVTLLEQGEFNVLRSSVWSDGAKASVFLFELESRRLPPLKKHAGPPVTSGEAASFLAKHVSAPRTFSGPWVERGRWFVETARAHTDAIELLKSRLGDGGKAIGVASLVAGAVRRGYTIAVNEEVLDFYQSNPAFAKFLTEFLRGRPSWLG